MATRAKATESAVQFVDTQLHSVANAVEKLAGIISATTANVEGGVGQKIGDPINRQLRKTVAKLREQNGEKIVDGMKDQMLLHPKATVGIAATVAAIAAQVALTMLKNERPKTAPMPIRAISAKSSSSKKSKAKKSANDDD